jgi:hypothetical protein
MKPKRLSFVPESALSKENILFTPRQQILDQIETICSQQGKVGNNTETFWFRFQNDVGTFVLSFYGGGGGRFSLNDTRDLKSKEYVKVQKRDNFVDPN